MIIPSMQPTLPCGFHSTIMITGGVQLCQYIKENEHSPIISVLTSLFYKQNHPYPPKKKLTFKKKLFMNKNVTFMISYYKVNKYVCDIQETFKLSTAINIT